MIIFFNNETRFFRRVVARSLFFIILGIFTKFVLFLDLSILKKWIVSPSAVYFNTSGFWDSTSFPPPHIWRCNLSSHSYFISHHSYIASIIIMRYFLGTRKHGISRKTIKVVFSRAFYVRLYVKFSAAPVSPLPGAYSVQGTKIRRWKEKLLKYCKHLFRARSSLPETCPEFLNKHFWLLTGSSLFAGSFLLAFFILKDSGKNFCT